MFVIVTALAVLEMQIDVAIQFADFGPLIGRSVASTHQSQSRSTSAIFSHHPRMADPSSFSLQTGFYLPFKTCSHRQDSSLNLANSY